MRTSGWNRFPDTQILEPRSSQSGSGMATILSAKLKVKQAININFPAKRFKCSSPGGLGGRCGNGTETDTADADANADEDIIDSAGDC